MRFIDTLCDVIFPPHERALRARVVSYETLALLLQPVRITAIDPPAISLLPYRNKLVQAAITEAKFHDARRAQEALGALLKDYLRVCTDPYVLVPVPLSRQRLQERGYNQAERICRAAQAQQVDTTLLERIRNTTPQTNLGGQERRINLQGAFRVQKALHPDTLYIVVDDVVTTGATLSAACAALKEAGAQRLLPIALAHSP